ncbi:hypothetical protein EI42_05011 [Thermosporothrix hazakensis]|uniref:Uncharacterized protein n=2 Tax=Thermosporothrix TaxID=768650 RepID=A0A326U965_THEHA|nr:hypothetical protein [Thermosporothrix hazakensis]PZW23389.1 hypothetical protein EI42_05011 [Thermosporothrix hazakensis]BBH89734.1 hypothetical protein KTC_44850 [Thermosporothrix sp. COM3]GCE47923.1 hypothetical protein KTH_27920 [Thermosporothrix hazakensis]
MNGIKSQKPPGFDERGRWHLTLSDWELVAIQDALFWRLSLLQQQYPNPTEEHRYLAYLLESVRNRIGLLLQLSGLTDQEKDLWK